MELLGYLRTDERKDVICSIEHCLSSLEKTRVDNSEWKWVILSMHSALQGAMICHLSGTANLGALSKKCADEWLDWHQRDRDGKILREERGRDEIVGMPVMVTSDKKDRPPDPHLADFKTLFRRLKNQNKAIEPTMAKRIEVGPDQPRDIYQLNDLRKQMTHFSPIGWSIELAGLPRIINTAAVIIEQIEADDWSFRHLEKKERLHFRKQLTALREACQHLG